MDSNFKPVIWAEDTMPLDASNYIQCEVCTPKSPIIWGEGNPKAPIMVILDNPGARKNKEGKEYICGTRITLQTALNQVNLTADDVYITYLLKCRPLRKYDKERARAFSKPFLEEQIRNLHPKIIICLGDTVVQSMLNSNESVKSLRGNWQNLMGFPTLVSYHPLAVRRRPNLMKQFIEDFQTLARGFESREY